MDYDLNVALVFAPVAMQKSHLYSRIKQFRLIYIQQDSTLSTVALETLHVTLRGI